MCSSAGQMHEGCSLQCCGECGMQNSKAAASMPDHGQLACYKLLSKSSSPALVHKSWLFENPLTHLTLPAPALPADQRMQASKS